MSLPGLCSQHQALASYRCDGCGKWLCFDCVEEDDGRFLAGTARCSFCGEQATSADDIDSGGFGAADSGGFGSGFATPKPAAPGRSPGPFRPAEELPAAVPDVLYTPPPEPVERDLGTAFAPTTRGVDAVPPFLLFAHHAVVPAATITMVSALLFFLLDLRSIYLGESDALKWLGFWFVTATVLIARYGKMSSYGAEGDGGRQGCYTSAMAIATICVLLSSPWEDAREGWFGPVISSLIFLAIWRFATRLTAGLSLEGEEWWSDEPRLYGLERLAAEELSSRREDRSVLRLSQTRKPAAKPPESAAAERGKSKAPGNPNLVVARLALLALLVFALSEPLLLSAPADIGQRAAAAMILFLFATGVVLGAASSVAGYRRVRAAGGRASVGVIPGRLAASAGLMAVILAVAASLPGIVVRGSGELLPQSTPPVTEDAAQTESRTDDAARANDRVRRQGSPAASLLETLSSLGRWLRIPFFLAVAFFGALGIWRLWPLLAGIRKNLRSDLSAWWARLAARFSGWFGGRRKPEPPADDPLQDLDSLYALPPREAVLGAYARLLSHFAQSGYPRPERLTPHEFLGSARRRFRGVASPVERLTDIYVGAAYGNAEVDAVDRREAIAAVTELVTQGPLKPRGPDALYPSGRADGTVS